MSNVLLSLEDVDYVRETLAAAHAYMHAMDLADSFRAGRAEVRVSTLTREVAATLEVVEQAVSDYLMAERDRERFSVGELDYDSEDEEDGEEEDD